MTPSSALVARRIRHRSRGLASHIRRRWCLKRHERAPEPPYVCVYAQREYVSTPLVATTHPPWGCSITVTSTQEFVAAKTLNELASTTKLCVLWLVTGGEGGHLETHGSLSLRHGPPHSCSIAAAPVRPVLRTCGSLQAMYWVFAGQGCVSACTFGVWFYQATTVQRYTSAPSTQ